MEDIYRSNIVEFCMIYLNRNLEFDGEDFTYYIYKELFNIDIIKDGYGLSNSTKEMTNDMGDLRIYKESDSKKINYLDDIKKGDLVFFHTIDNSEDAPTPNNKYPGLSGIYLGNGEFIHYSSNDDLIVINKLEDDWLKKLVASRDIIKKIVN